MKTKLLAKVKKGIFATKVQRFGMTMYKLSGEQGMNSDNGIYCVDMKSAVVILREMRLEAARNIFRRKEERRLRV